MKIEITEGLITQRDLKMLVRFLLGYDPHDYIDSSLVDESSLIVRDDISLRIESPTSISFSSELGDELRK